MVIPVIDLFAGPGGLGEGFSAYRDSQGKHIFKIALSVEKDPTAHETLKLRSFFRQFSKPEVPEEYYDHLRGKLDRSELYRLYANEAEAAEKEAWNAELGDEKTTSASTIDRRIRQSLQDADDWILIGGPPCQAYSIVGRSRVRPVDPKKYESDVRHFLYKAYLRIIAEHRPPVFVMENVRGILTAEVGGQRIIDLLLSDLRHPVPAAAGERGKLNGGLEYKIYPLSDYQANRGLFNGESLPEPEDYIIKSEEHRIPQARHRFILLGIRSDVEARPQTLRNSEERIKMWSLIKDLPRLRSRLSNGEDSGQNWLSAISAMLDNKVMNDPGLEREVSKAMKSTIRQISTNLPVGNCFMGSDRRPDFQRQWFYDPRLKGVCNHVGRSHMDSDLWRYLFAACYANIHKKSPKLPQFPKSLLPEHKNVNGDADDFIFRDRFRVQLRDKPATTITSHISKDGHYFIHPDARQCRSLTVREAARLQTFPDNYFFAGPTTEQYQQVGNAVPPLLAVQIARIVDNVLKNMS